MISTLLVSDAIDIWAVPREKPTLWTPQSNDPDQPKLATQANPDRHVSPHVEFLLQETLDHIYLYPPETKYVGPD